MLKKWVIYWVLLSPLWVCGQARVDMSAPVRVTSGGAVTSVNYGYQNKFTPNVRYMRSEERYMRSAWGLLPSEDRYVRHASGRLRSEGRYAPVHRSYPSSSSQQGLAMQTQTAIGSIRYHAPPSQNLADHRIKTQVGQPMYGPKPVSMPGSVRYGSTTTRLASQPRSSFSTLHSSRQSPMRSSSVSQKSSPSGRGYRTTAPHYSSGSLRYSQ